MLTIILCIIMNFAFIRNKWFHWLIFPNNIQANKYTYYMLVTMALHIKEWLKYNNNVIFLVNIQYYTLYSVYTKHLDPSRSNFVIKRNLLNLYIYNVKYL
jgi:hypothetical protein